jgi:hypothetical protein
MKTRQPLLSEKAAEERSRAFEWLLPFVDKPRYLTKAELREAAIRELQVSKSSFDFAWTEVIERTHRYDWYQPLLGRRKHYSAIILWTAFRSNVPPHVQCLPAQLFLVRLLLAESYPRFVCVHAAVRYIMKTKGHLEQ